MSNLTLTLVCWDYDRTRALIDGRVRPDGIDLDVSVMRPREAFTRMLELEEFDIAEVSLAAYSRLKAEGDERFVGLPIALSRMFRHSCIYVRAGSGITHPQHMRGRRVGAVQLDSTGMVFIKGMLLHDYGLRSNDVQWVVGGLESPACVAAPKRGHGDVEALGLQNTLCNALESGYIDALISNHMPSQFIQATPKFARLFPNYKSVEKDYFKRTGLFPIMHVIVMRAELYMNAPDIAARVYKAFCEARDVAINGLYDTDALRLTLPWLIDHLEETQHTFGADFWSYGSEENRKVWNALCEYQVEQGLASRKVELNHLFVTG